MDKAEVAAILDEIAVLLELRGENPFRARAYATAGRTIAQLEVNLADVVAAGTLDEIPGIGETLRDKITTLVTTGKLPFYEDLKAKTPPGLLELLRLPGVGPKKVKVLFEDVGIDSLAKLKAAAEAGTIAKLKGFGEKTQTNILQGLAFLNEGAGRVRIDQAVVIAEALVAGVRSAPASSGWSCAAACGGAAKPWATSISSSAPPMPGRSSSNSSSCRRCSALPARARPRRAWSSPASTRTAIAS